MSSDLRKQIYSELELKESDDLLTIWQDNDRTQWSDEAFGVIQAILKARGVALPQQGEPVYEDDEEDWQEAELSAEELAILNDENPPAFYEPFEVLRVVKRLEWMVGATIALIVTHNVLNFPTSLDSAQRYLLGFNDRTMIFVLTALMIAAKIVLSIFVVYVPIKVLTNILRILMEMEFRSRQAG